VTPESDRRPPRCAVIVVSPSLPFSSRHWQKQYKLDKLRKFPNPSPQEIPSRRVRALPACLPACLPVSGEDAQKVIYTCSSWQVEVIRRWMMIICHMPCGLRTPGQPDSECNPAASDLQSSSKALDATVLSQPLGPQNTIPPFHIPVRQVLTPPHARTHAYAYV
jgi:hypothetical protein